MYSDEIRRLCLKYHQIGDSYATIAKKLDISRSAAQNLISYKLKKLRKKSGPKPIIGKAASLMLRRFIANENTKGVKVTTRSILRGTNADISKRTLNNWLSKNDFTYKKGVQNVELTTKHRKLRVQLISSWIHDNIPWEKAVFTDEKRFTVDGPDNWLLIF